MPPVLRARDSIDAGARIAQRFGQLRDLPEHPLFALIHARLAMGASPFATAKWVQATVAPEDPYSPVLKPLMTLNSRLRRYAAMLPATAKVPRSYLDDLTKGLQIETNVVAELASAIYYQKQRISQFAPREKDFPLGITAEQQREEVVTRPRFHAHAAARSPLGDRPGNHAGDHRVVRSLFLGRRQLPRSGGDIGGGRRQAPGDPDKPAVCRMGPPPPTSA
jgi:hypothetical protein